MRTIIKSAAGRRARNRLITIGEQGRNDPSHPNNTKGADNTETSVIYDAAAQDTIDFTFEGYTDNLFWYSGDGANAPNGNPYWERLGTASVPFGIDLTTVDTTGWVEAEVWGVVQAENDPETAPLDLSGSIGQFGSGSSITIYPTSDLGAGTRSVWTDFGATVRTEHVDGTLVSAGFDAPSLNAWHIVREQVTGSAGAGNLTHKWWLNGTLVATTAGLTSGWKATPRFWGAEAGATTRGWAGRMAFFQVFDRALNNGEANKQLKYLQGRFGI